MMLVLAEGGVTPKSRSRSTRTRHQNSQLQSLTIPTTTCRSKSNRRPQPRGSAVRQREPVVDEDGLPLDDVEYSALKRRRLGQLCTRRLLTEMTEIFDKQ